MLHKSFTVYIYGNISGGAILREKRKNRQKMHRAQEAKVDQTLKKGETKPNIHRNIMNNTFSELTNERSDNILLREDGAWTPRGCEGVEDEIKCGEERE